MPASSLKRMPKLELLRIMYDAQLKKMLAYVGASITSFVAQLTVFYLAVGKVLAPHTPVAIIVATLLWLSESYFAVAVVTKYQELKALEQALGIAELRRRIYYPNRPRFSRLWDRLHREFLGIEAGDYSRLAAILDAGTFVVVAIVTLMWVCIVWLILS
jgi:hypothetical protein